MSRLWNPYANGHIRNPYQMYDRLQKEAPVYRSQTGEWILSKYEDVFEILGSESMLVGNRLDWVRRQQEYLTDSRVDFKAIADAMQTFLVLLNPPEHTRIRRMVSKAWSDHHVENIIQENIDTLLSRLGTEFDLIRDFAVPLPVMTICRIMGIDVAAHERLKALSEKMIQSFDLYASLKEFVLISEAAATYLDFFKNYIRFRKQQPSDDLVSKVIAKNDASEQPVSEEELISICIFLFVAGEETTMNLIGNGMLALLRDPDRLRDLQNNPSIAGEAINELLRFDSPVQLVGRIAAEDLQINGHQIKRGDTLTLVVGAANRDPDKFKDPHRLSFQRNFKQHLAFGRGKHYCLGAWLARLQGELAIKSLVKHFPKIKMQPQTLTWNKHLAVRGIKSLKVTVN